MIVVVVGIGRMRLVDGCGQLFSCCERELTLARTRVDKVPRSVHKHLGPVVVATRVVRRVVSRCAHVSERARLARLVFPRRGVTLVPVGCAGNPRGHTHRAQSERDIHREPCARRILLIDCCDWRVGIDLAVWCSHKLDGRRCDAPALSVDAGLCCGRGIRKIYNKRHVSVVHATTPQPVWLSARLGEDSVREHIVEKDGFWYSPAMRGRVQQRSTHARSCAAAVDPRANGRADVRTRA